jgi:hypothetical protein
MRTSLLDVSQLLWSVLVLGTANRLTERQAGMDILHGTLAILGQHRVAFIVSWVLITLLIVAKRFFAIEYDPREPPIISHPIPYVGHVIGMFRHGASYFDFIK